MDALKVALNIFLEQAGPPINGEIDINSNSPRSASTSPDLFPLSRSHVERFDWTPETWAARNAYQPGPSYSPFVYADDEPIVVAEVVDLTMDLEEEGVMPEVIDLTADTTDNDDSDDFDDDASGVSWMA